MKILVSSDIDGPILDYSEDNVELSFLIAVDKLESYEPDELKNLTVLYPNPIRLLSDVLLKFTSHDIALSKVREFYHSLLAFYLRNQKQLDSAVFLEHEKVRNNHITLDNESSSETVQKKNLIAEILFLRDENFKNYVAELKKLNDDTNVRSINEVSKILQCDEQGLTNTLKRIERKIDRSAQLNESKLSKDELKKENEVLIRNLQDVQEEFLIKNNELRELRNILSKVKDEQENYSRWLLKSVVESRYLLWDSNRVFSKKIKKEAELLSQSEVFCSEEYLAKYPDLAGIKIDPEIHYLLSGAYELRNPSNKFDTRFYVTNNQDVIDSGIHPIIHYINYGTHEGRLTKLA